MIFGSVCSGIEAASVAWEPLGWRCAFVAEIDPFPSAVLAHRYPETPNLGDFTRIDASAGPIDLLVGGTPCQSFSVAGLRKGLADDRGNLALEFLRLAYRSGAAWVVWENVPGVLSSNGGRDFACFLGGLTGLDIPVPPDGWRNSGVIPGASTRHFGAAYRVLDAQYLGLAQQRLRVFVVGHLGDWRRAAAVLFERHALSPDSPPSRPSRQADSADATCCPPIPIHNVHYTDRGTNRDGCGIGEPGAPAFTVETRNRNAIAFDTTQITSPGNYSHPKPGRPCHPLAATAHPPAIAFQERGRDGGRSLEWQEELSYSLRAIDGGGCGDWFRINQGWVVRRLTPRECERLQGFPDDWTLVPYRGKPAADGPRYKAIGNSMAVPVMAWIGRQIFKSVNQD